MTEQTKSCVRIFGDSIGDAYGNHFVIRYDENNKPIHFEINGEPVNEEEYRAARFPSSS